MREGRIESDGGSGNEDDYGGIGNYGGDNNDNDGDDSMSITSSEDSHFYVASTRRQQRETSAMSSLVDAELSSTAEPCETITSTTADWCGGDSSRRAREFAAPSTSGLVASTVAQRSRKKTRKQIVAEDATTSTTSPSKRRRVDAKRRPPPSGGGDNQHLNRALAIRNGQDMVRVACNNRSNLNNIELMEWSEAVLLQLCYINEPLDFDELDWQAVKQILHYQWRLEVTLPLQEHVGSKETLSNIIIRNHAKKLNAGLIQQNEMFTEATREHLKINYRLLSEYAMENKRRERTTTINSKLKLH